MSDSGSDEDLQSFAKRLKETPKKRLTREAWHTLSVLSVAHRSYKNGDGYTRILEIDGVDQNGDNTRLVCFSDREAFPTLLEAVPGGQLKVSSPWHPFAGKMVIQEVSQAEILSPSEYPPSLREVSLADCAHMTGLWLCRVHVDLYTPRVGEEVYIGCNLCFLSGTGAGQCPVPGCPGTMKVQGRGTLTLSYGHDSLRVAADLKSIAVAADMCPRLLRRVAKTELTLGSAVNRALDTSKEFWASIYQDIYKGKQLTLLTNLEEIDMGRVADKTHRH